MDVHGDCATQKRRAQASHQVVCSDSRFTGGPPAGERALGVTLGGHDARPNDGGRRRREIICPRADVLRLDAGDSEAELRIVESVRQFQAAAGHRCRDRGRARLLCAYAGDAKIGDASIHGGNATDDAEIHANRRCEDEALGLNLTIRRLVPNMGFIGERPVVQDDARIEGALPPCEADAAPRCEQTQRAGEDRATVQVAAAGHMIEERESGRLPQVERMHRGLDRSAYPDGERLAPVGDVDPVRVDRRRPDVEPSLRAEYPPPAHARVALRAHGVDPHLAHVRDVDVLEIDHPQRVVRVRQLGRRGPDIGERRIGKAGDGRQGRHDVRGRIRRIEP